MFLYVFIVFTWFIVFICFLVFTWLLLFLIWCFLFLYSFHPVFLSIFLRLHFRLIHCVLQQISLNFYLSLINFFKSKLTISFTKILIEVLGFHLSSSLAFFEFPSKVSTSKGLKYSLSQATIQLLLLS